MPVKYKCATCGKSNNALKREGQFTVGGWALGHCSKCGQNFCLEHNFKHLAAGDCADKEFVKDRITEIVNILKEEK